MCDGGGGGGGGGCDGDGVSEVVQVSEEHFVILEEIRVLKKAAREQEIRDELEYRRRLHVLSTLHDERAGLEIEIKVCDVGVAAYGRGPLSDIEEEELVFLRSCIALKRARVSEQGLQISEVQLTVKKAAAIVRLHEERRAKKDALQAEVNPGLEACAKEDALRAEVFRKPGADRLSALNVSAAAPPKGQCPDGGITRSCLALTTSSNPDGGDTYEVEAREESDGAADQQQPQRQQQPQQPRPQQQQQGQVGPLSACGDRPEEQQRKQQQSQEGSVSPEGCHPGNQQPVDEEEMEGVDKVEERAGLVMGVEQKGLVEERAKVGAGGGVCIIGWEAEHGRKRRRCPKRERVTEK